MKRYKLSNTAELKALYTEHTKKRQEIVFGARERAATRALPAIKERVPHASGELADSIEVKVTGKQVRIGSDAPHFLPVDQGTRPHYPPIAPLLEWCALKGLDEGVAYAIQQKIGEEGTEPTNFSRDALDLVLEALKEEVRAALERMP